MLIRIMILLRIFSLANALLYRLLGARRSYLRVGPVRLAYYQSTVSTPPSSTGCRG